MTATAVDRFRALDPWAQARFLWRADARPEQLFEEHDDWDVAFYMAGRGTGKTRSGGEETKEVARVTPDARLALVGATFGDVRDTMIEGESGLLAHLPPSALRWGSIERSYNRSLGEVFFSNGAQAKAFSSEKPNRLRGPQHHFAWVDEPGAFKDAHRGDALDTTWNNLMLGMRLGERPRVVVTGTPKRVKLVSELLTIPRPRLLLTRGTTYDNLKNLAPTFREAILSRYEGTRIGRQELLGELLDDYEGALWNRDLISDTRVASAPELARIAIGVDPSTWSPETSGEHDTIGQGIETGIVVVGITNEHPAHAYVLDDLSGRLSPQQWAQRAVDAWRQWSDVAPTTIVPEVNLGGWITSLIMAADPLARIYTRNGRAGVRASQAKRARAEPVSGLYEQRRVHHVGTLPLLEDQMCVWDPQENWSPDRIDALVWAVTALAPWGAGPATSSGHRAAQTRLPAPALIGQR